MGDRQLEHSEIINTCKLFQIKVICENINTPENVGMIFRNCEALGVEEIVFTGSSIIPPNRKISKVSRSTDFVVPFRYVESTQTVLNELRDDNYKLLALEITSESLTLSEFKFDVSSKYAVVVGSERFGIDKDTIISVDKCVHIPMYGKNTSLNVVSALTIFLYELTRQLA